MGWIRSLLPEYYQWRLDKAKNFQECVDALLVLVTDEDVYLKKIEAEIRAYPRCYNIRQDKKYLMFLSRKVTKLMDIDQNNVVSPSQCTKFFSKLSSQSEQKDLNKTIKARQRKANDRLGTMNYERPLQIIIVQQLKLIDTTLSGQVTGTNIDMADENKTQLISHSYTNATSLPIRSALPAQNSTNNMSSRMVEKVVQKEDPLGNKLWRSDGKPQMTTIMVEESVPSAQTHFTQVPQITPPTNPTNPMLPPEVPFQQNGAGFNQNGRGRGRGRGGNFRGTGRGGNGQASGTVRSTNATGGNNNGPKQKPPCTL